MELGCRSVTLGWFLLAKEANISEQQTQTSTLKKSFVDKENS